MSPPSNSSVPPRYTPDEREDFYKKLKELHETVRDLERAAKRRDALENRLDALREAVDTCTSRVDDMLTRDSNQSEKIARLERSMTDLGAKHGGMTGAVAGEAAGVAASQKTFSQRGAFYLTLVMVISAATTGIIQGVQAATAPVRPVPTLSK
jgi:septal ring factor EnvC (AmiA/AmiB activator)